MKRFTDCLKDCALGQRTARALAVAFIWLVACGDEKEEPITCGTNDRHGTYLLTYTELGGNCGPIPPSVIIVDSNQADDCTIEFENKSDDNCTFSSQFTCDDGEVFGEFTSTTTQETDSGSVVTGTIAMTLEEIGTSNTCTGTYRIKYVRQ